MLTREEYRNTLREDIDCGLRVSEVEEAIIKIWILEDFLEENYPDIYYECCDVIHDVCGK